MCHQSLNFQITCWSIFSAWYFCHSDLHYSHSWSHVIELTPQIFIKKIDHYFSFSSWFFISNVNVLIPSFMRPWFSIYNVNIVILTSAEVLLVLEVVGLIQAWAKWQSLIPLQWDQCANWNCRNPSIKTSFAAFTIVREHHSHNTYEAPKHNFNSSATKFNLLCWLFQNNFSFKTLSFSYITPSTGLCTCPVTCPGLQCASTPYQNGSYPMFYSSGRVLTRWHSPR
jgi:hypothetical protein